VDLLEGNIDNFKKQQLYLQDLIKERQLETYELQADLADYQKDLEIIYAPFNNDSNDSYLTTVGGGTFIDKPKPRQDPFHHQQSETDELMRQSQFVFLVYLLLALFCSFDRAIFFDVMHKAINNSSSSSSTL
jgi:hypothetical protein